MTQETLDKISDDFQSTFTLLSPNLISNLFYEKEIPVVMVEPIAKCQHPPEKVRQHVNADAMDWFECECGQEVEPASYKVSDE